MGSKVYSLADELSLKFGELLDLARQEDIKVFSHMSTLTSEQVEHLRNVAEKRAIDIQREKEVEKRLEEGDRREAQEKRKIEELVAVAEKAIGTRRIEEPAAAAAATAVAPPAASPPPTAAKKETPKKEKEKKTERAKDRVRREEKEAEERLAQQEALAQKKAASELAPGVEKEVEITLPVTVKDLSQALGIKAGAIIQALMKNQQAMVTINHSLSEDLIETVALEFERQIKIKKKEDVHDIVREVETRAMARPATQQQPRPPVVAFLGHVDHGKTSLLDRIRDTNVVAGEAGGITQKIGAWSIETPKGKITFIDTPGHQAFTEMRSRGARATDIVVLVVAADDGVMPQTVEAISHARAAEVPIVVALNKIDKPNASPDKVKGQLAQADLAPDDWGGKTPVVPCSALTGEGVDDLLEMIHLVSEMGEFKADANSPAQGVVLEAEISEGKGVMATLLIREGTLEKGDAILCDVAFGRIRSMYDHRDKKLEKAGPSMAVRVTGLDIVPMAGEKFYVFEDPKKAREVAQARQQRARTETLAAKQTVRLDDIFGRIQEGQMKGVALVVKCDYQGSVEVLKKELGQLAHKEVKVDVKHAAVGGINESDVLLAETSGGIILGFNVVPDDRAKKLAEQKRVEVRFYNVIYELLDDVKLAMEGLLAPEEKEEVLGHCDIRQVFSASKLGKIAGCYVTDGMFDRKADVRLIRDNVVIYTGKIASLRRIKDDVKEVEKGFECGLRIEGYDDIKPGDRVECFRIVKIARKLE
ncbi:MAG: translation initiation factor IF-2 [Planctomycetes bacterium]|nr:translation initiation factor IF-2 [Planctomycetota bacterium]